MGTLLLILGDYRRKRLALAFWRVKPSGPADINVESFFVELHKKNLALLPFNSLFICLFEGL